MIRCTATSASRRPILALALGGALLLVVPFAHAEETACAVTPGGWGAPPSGGNNGELLHANFDAVFGAELVVGDLVFADAQAVTDAMPYEGPGSAFTSHAVALAINIAMGEAGLLDGSIGDLEVPSGAYAGWTSAQILAEAESVLIATADDEDLQGHALIGVMTAYNEQAYGCGGDVAPECPDDLVALPQSDGSVLLSWGAVDGAVEYAVYRGADGGALIALDTTTSTTYRDETTAVGTAYEYSVTAYDGDLESEGCATVMTTAVPFFGAPLLGALAVGGSVAAFRVMKRKA